MARFPLLVADSGGTKTDWALVVSHGTLPHLLTSEGWSPTGRGSNQTAAELGLWLTAQPELNQPDVAEVHFYGAGMTQPAAEAAIQAALRHTYPDALVHVRTDLLGAARAVAGHRPALVGITGTGSIAGLYDGQAFTRLSGGYGYLITDPGSAAHIGQCLLAELLRGRASAASEALFQEQLGATLTVYVQSLYASRTPQRDLAAVTQALFAHLAHEAWVQAVFEGCLAQFWLQDIIPLLPPLPPPVALVGSLAHACEALHRRLAQQHGLPAPTILARPLQALVAFHVNHE